MRTLLTTILLFFVFAVQSQTLVSITPATGAAGTSVNVTIAGNGTSFTNSTIFLMSSGTSILTVSNVAASSATSVQATVAIPANAVSGSYTLTTFAGIIPIQLANAFTVTGGGGTGASITSLDPNEGYQGQFLAITISGANTSFTQSSSITAALVKGISGTPITSFGASAMDDTTLMAYFSIPTDAALGSYSLLLTTDNEGILTKPNAFTVTSNPLGELTHVSPDHGNKGETLDVTISGSGTSFTQASFIGVELYGTTSGSQLTVNTTTTINDSTLLCNITIPASSRVGAYDVYMMIDGGGFLQLTEGFTVIGDPSTDPRIVSVSPATAHQGETLDITISGANTHFTQGSETLMAIYNQTDFVEPISFNVVNDSVIIVHFEIPVDFPIEVYDVGVQTDMDGYIDLPQSFTITANNTAIAEENKDLEKLQVYPNPVKNELMFVTDHQVKQVSVTDLTGKQITIPLDDIRQSNKVCTIDIERYRIGKGIYFIRVETDQGMQYQKFIVD